MTDYKSISRRNFLKATTLTAASLLSPGPVFMAQTSSSAGTALGERRLIDVWEYHQGPLGGPWDVWRPDPNNNVGWQPVQVPHCFKANRKNRSVLSKMFEFTICFIPIKNCGNA